MSNGKASRARFGWALLFAAVAATGLLVWGCGGGGEGGGGSGSSSSAPGVTPPVTPPMTPPATFPISAFTNAGGGFVIVNAASTSTLAVGDLVVITGTTNYNGSFVVTSVTPTSFAITAPFVVDDATGFWQLAGGFIAGCTTTGATGAITLATSVSRFSGVAPLAVFFDASGTTTVPATPRPFHDLGYGWNFGDAGPSAGIWGIGSRPSGPTASSRNSATGPLAAHVYETPGTYDVTLAITDGTNTVTNACMRISVLDPEVVFADSNTICFSTSGTPCPNALAVQVTTSNFGTALAMAAPGKRLLFRRGETWTSFSGANIPRLSANGPGIVGAYGAGARPLVRPDVAIVGNTAILAISSAATPNISDWRIMDLEFAGVGGATDSDAIRGGGGAQQITLLRMVLRDISNGIQFNAQGLDSQNLSPPGGHLVFDQIAIVDSNIQRISGAGNNGMFLQARRMAVLGNFVEDSTAGEHIVRVQYVSKGVFQANDLGLPAPGPGGAKNVMTLRAVNVGTGGVTSPNNTDQVVISDNLFRGGLATQAISIQPSGGTEDQRIGNIIFDGNVVRAGPSLQTAIVSAADEITLRNNIFDMTGGTAFNCITPQQLGAEPVHSAVRIFNNTCFSNTAGGGALRVVNLRGNQATPGPVGPASCGQQNVSIGNNLGFAPNLVGATVLMLESLPCTATPGLALFGNSSDAQIASTPPLFTNGSGTFSLTTDFTVGAGSYAVNAGAAVPVFSDLFRTLRPQAAVIDIGAAEQ